MGGLGPLQLKFPSLNLEEKVIFNGGSIVRKKVSTNGANDDNKAENPMEDKTNDERKDDPQNVELRRNMREKKHNKKYGNE